MLVKYIISTRVDKYHVSSCKSRKFDTKDNSNIVNIDLLDFNLKNTKYRQFSGIAGNPFKNETFSLCCIPLVPKNKHRSLLKHDFDAVLNFATSKCYTLKKQDTAKIVNRP